MKAQRPMTLEEAVEEAVEQERNSPYVKYVPLTLEEAAFVCETFGLSLPGLLRMGDELAAKLYRRAESINGAKEAATQALERAFSEWLPIAKRGEP